MYRYNLSANEWPCTMSRTSASCAAFSCQMSLISREVSLFPSRLLRTCPSYLKNLGTSGPVPCCGKEHSKTLSWKMQTISTLTEHMYQMYRQHLFSDQNISSNESNGFVPFESGRLHDNIHVVWLKSLAGHEPHLQAWTGRDLKMCASYQVF